VLPTPAVCQCWHFWTCRRPSTQSTTWSSCAGCFRGPTIEWC